MGWLRENWLDALIFLLIALVVAGIVLYLTGINPFARTPAPAPSAPSAPASTPLPAPPSGARPSSEPASSEPVVTVLPLPQAPAEAPEAPEAPRAPQAPQASQVSQAPSRSESPAPEARPASGVWRVAVGSFSNPENALRLSRELSQKGFNVRLEAAGAYTRVVVGPYASEEEARRAAQALSAYNPQVYRGQAPVSGAYLQVGAFQKEENALALASRLKEAGIPAVVRKDGLYRVQVGPVSEENKEALRARLEGMGLSPVEVR
ncbi:SPOR domain-containing protein [Thermus filiformis]|uniref:Sporulation protein n=1 Tax=Thermus filiformis TaxID=276 RepID=A0A0A2WT92_THEFI|nr:SPOR domain-containing protein [Thermus filiformis]KGQ21525.2 sporulation protein [Thermus filiformis]